MAEMEANIALIDGMAVELNNHYMADLAAALLANPGHLAALNLAVENLEQGQLHALGLDQDAAGAELAEAGEPEAEQGQEQGGEYFEDYVDIPIEPVRIPINCDWCDKTFKFPSRMKNHLNSVHLQIRAKCNLCEATFASPSGRSVHYWRQHRGKSITCEDCGRKFSTKAHMQRHQQAAHREKTKECPDCESVFSDQTYLKDHIKTVHKGAKTRTCLVCLKTFSSRSAFSYHKRAHLGMSFPCEFCPAVFRQNVHLTRHCKTLHLGCRFECDLCGQQCTSQQIVREHIRTQHGY